MKFKDIPGKTIEKKKLTTTISKGRLPHAQIFLGKEGSGNLAMALATASYIVCENRTMDDSCGVCNQCQKSNKLVHPDIHFSFPVIKYGDKKRELIASDDFLPQWRAILAIHPYISINQWLQHIDAENSQPNINVKECNDIIHKLNMMSYESPYKILIMWLPEYLGTEGNRLLKLIEEPTENTFIMLVAQHQEQILQTILSRCQLVKTPSFSNVEISQFIHSNLDIDTSKSEQIANLADGNMSLAWNIAKNQEADYSEKLITWLRSAYKSDPLEVNLWMNSILELNKDEQKSFFEYGLHFFRQYNYLHQTKNGDVQLTHAEKDIAQKMSSIIDFEKSVDIIKIIEEALDNIVRNVNIKIMLFADTLKIGSILRKKMET